ncbi:hypothetical protein EVAR_82665_1 [Eumeta japonica]|uniref:Uncharacterized protein n=1 Tax=Eumeta variegata TaxID=151549 RepID=A0A4C1VAD1_EUMVA|nr:hypothetical protein EVAR_82665_1 [Eumeta japonica]
MDPGDKNALISDHLYDEDSRSAVNSCILDYYKKFGRKRDLEQYFSLSTAQGDVSDPSGLFWRRMKTQYDSDSGEKKSESSTELCRVSITCSIPVQSSDSQNEKLSKPTSNTDSDSPPIISEEKSLNLHQEEDENSDVDSQKSMDNMVNTSVNKLPSPTSSINSQKKLEWDSLADVGYANEGDRKTSSSSLSTLERLALQQQYTNNENVKTEINIGLPTAQSTPLEEVQDNKSKTNRKSLIKSTKYYKKDVDYVQVNVPQESDSARPINVNLTKHISFNVGDKNNVTAQTSNHDEKHDTPKMVSVETVVAPELFDKEIQTSLSGYKDSQTTEISDHPERSKNRKIMHKSLRTPVIIHMNNLRRYTRNRKNKSLSKRPSHKKKLYVFDKHTVSRQEKTGDPISEAESFEYMPGHVYQNQNKDDRYRSKNSAGNKSSLESSSHLTTESSKETNISFTRDLERSIDQLKRLVEKRQKNATFKNKIVKEIIQKLVRSKYKDDDSGADLLTAFSFNSKLFDFGQGDNTTTSTSDQNSTTEKSKERPRKSILRRDKLDRNVSSTIQNHSNLLNVMNKHNPTNSKVSKKVYSDSESEQSSNKYSSEGVKTSSEELYLKFLSAYKKEEEYKRYLKEKEGFLKQKLSSTAKHNKPRLTKNVDSDELNHLLKDLATIDYNNGSGDAFKLPSNIDSITEKDNIINKELNTQKCHSVYTLSSGNSANVSCSHNTQKLDKKIFSTTVPEKGNKEKCTKCKKHKNDKNEENCYDYCCLEHFLKARNVTDCSVQADLPIKPQQKTCSVNTDQQSSEKTSDNYAQPFKTDEFQFSAYKCENDNLMTKDKDCCTLNRNTYINKEIIASKSSQENDIIITTDDYKNARKKNGDHEVFEPQSLVPDEQKTDSKNLMKTNDFCCSSGSVIKPSQCIQTDISIYPKTSNPTLSDILTINETANGRDCGVGIGQSLKTVESMTYNLPYSDADSKFVEICSSKSKVSNLSGFTNEGRWHSKSDFRLMQISELNKKNLDNSKTSKVKHSLHDEQRQMITTEKGNKVVQGINTDILNCCDKETSLHDECSKGIQCCTNEVFTHNLQSNGHSIEQSSQSKPDQNNDGVLSEKIFAKDNEIQFKYDSNNNDECNILHDQSKAVKNFNEEFDIVRRLCSQIPEHIQRLNRYHTYPPSKHVREEKILKPTDTYSKPKHSNTKQSEEISKKLACLKHLNEVDSKENDLGKYSTVQTIKTEEIYTNNHSGKNKFSKSETEEVNEVLNEFIFERCESKKANSDSYKDSKSNSNTSKSSHASSDPTKDPIMAMIKSITRRYSKCELDKPNKKKCFKEIMFILNYLLDTDESTDTDNLRRSTSITTSEHVSKVSNEIKITSPHEKNLVDRGTQFYKQTKSLKRPKKSFEYEDTSDVPTSSDLQESTNESPAYEVLNRIKKECEKYQRRCKSNRNRKIEALSSSSVHCEQSDTHPDTEEEPSYGSQNSKFLTDIGENSENPCQDHATKTVSEYLERNRPDFLAKSLKRQDCLKIIKETRAQERETERLLLEELEIDAPEIAAQLRAFDGRLPINRQRRIGKSQHKTYHDGWQ